MDDLSSHHRATLACQVLLAVLAVAAVLIAITTVRDIQQAMDVRLHWERHPAEVASTADPNAVELELAADLLPRLGAVRQTEFATPHQSGNVRVLLPRPAYAWYEVFDQVDIAFDPQQPGRVRIIDLGAQAFAPAAYPGRPSPACAASI